MKTRNSKSLAAVHTHTSNIKKEKVIAFSIMMIMCLGMLTACGKPTKEEIATYSGRTFSSEGFDTAILKMNEKEKVPVPEGFAHVEGTTKKNGFVIKDTSNNNEFVWVPLGDISKQFVEILDLKEDDTRRKPITDFLAGYTGNEPDNEEMKKSIEQYGGFYVSKREINNVDGKASSANTGNVWTNISVRPG